MTYAAIIYTRESQYDILECDILDIVPIEQFRMLNHKHFHYYAHQMVNAIRKRDEKVSSILREDGFLQIVTGDMDNEATYTLKTIFADDTMKNKIDLWK